MSSNPLTDLDTIERARLEALLVEFDLRWSPDRLDADVCQLPPSGSFRAAALREMAEADLIAMQAETRARVTEILAELARVNRLTMLYHGTVLPQASATVASALAAYQVGKVDFMTSAGLRALLTMAKLVQSARGEMRICSPSPAVRDVLTTSGFNSLIHIFDDEMAAVESWN